MENLYPIMIVAMAACAGMLVAFALAFRKLNSAGASLPVTAEWIEALSPDRYRPMMRLLDSNDVSSLRGAPGFTPAMEARLRKQHCVLFKAYLRCLCADFTRVTSALKLVLVYSRVDRPDLASALVHHQLRFASGLVLVHFQLFLYRRGIGTINPACLLGIFDSMLSELQSMRLNYQPAGA